MDTVTSNIKITQFASIFWSFEFVFVKIKRNYLILTTPFKSPRKTGGKKRHVFFMLEKLTTNINISKTNNQFSTKKWSAVLKEAQSQAIKLLLIF